MLTRFRMTASVGVTMVAASLVFAGCSTTSSDEESAPASGAKVTISTNDGQVEVPKNPQRVVALDNTSAETLKAFGVTPVAIPKKLFAENVLGEWINDADIKDVGTHGEPKLDVVEDVKPDLIVGGYRFQRSADELKKIAERTGATYIDIAATDESEGGRVPAMTRQTTALGTVFGKEDEATKINSEFTANLDAAKAQANGQTVFLAITNGGKIDNGAKRMKPFVDPLSVKDVFAGAAGDVHQNSGLTPEAIAQADPQWVIVMDRDAAVKPTDGSTPQPAAEIFKAQEAFKGKAFFDQDRIFYLDPSYYLRESIQDYGDNYKRLAEAFAAKK